MLITHESGADAYAGTDDDLWGGSTWMAASISDGLRATGKAVDHAADSLRASDRDAMRTDDAVHSGFNRARLD